MFVEACVFCSDEGVDDIGGDILEFDVAAIAFIPIIFSHWRTILREYFGCLGDGGVFQLLQGGKGPEDAQVDKDQEKEKGTQAIEKDFPKDGDQLR
jgi:hypothetical protein